MITVTTLVIIALVGVFLEMKMLLHFGADLIPHAIMGSYLGWYFLRFLHVHPDGTVGDISKAFEFTILFPEVCSPWISPLGTFVYNVVKLCGYFKKRDSQLLPNVQVCNLLELQDARGILFSTNF